MTMYQAASLVEHPGHADQKVHAGGRLGITMVRIGAPARKSGDLYTVGKKVPIVVYRGNKMDDMAVRKTHYATPQRAARFQGLLQRKSRGVFSKLNQWQLGRDVVFSRFAAPSVVR